MSRERANNRIAEFDVARGLYKAAMERVHEERIGTEKVAPLYIFKNRWERTKTFILFGPYDVRDGARRYQFSLQQVAGEAGGVRVRVGCRYYTLPQAWAHWSSRKYYHKNQGQQALTIIKLLVLQAQSLGLIKQDVKFDSSIVKSKKRKTS